MNANIPTLTMVRCHAIMEPNVLRDMLPATSGKAPSAIPHKAPGKAVSAVPPSGTNSTPGKSPVAQVPQKAAGKAPPQAQAKTVPRHTDPAPPTRVLKLIIDGNNFWHAATGHGAMNKNAQVAKALRATVDYFKTKTYPGIKVEGVWVDLDVYEYIKFLDSEVKDRDMNEGMKTSALERQKFLQRLMNSITGTVPEITFKEVGKFKPQSGFVEGLRRSKVWVQSGVDESVLCHTIEAYVDKNVDVVVLCTGDGDMAPVFDVCNLNLRLSSGKEPLRLCSASKMCSSEFGNGGRLAGQQPIFLDKELPENFAPRSQTPPRVASEKSSQVKLQMVPTPPKPHSPGLKMSAQPIPFKEYVSRLMSQQQPLVALHFMCSPDRRASL
eukprot:PhF_6_TR11534/c1_g4_i7/m.18501